MTTIAEWEEARRKALIEAEAREWVEKQEVQRDRAQRTLDETLRRGAELRNKMVTASDYTTSEPLSAADRASVAEQVRRQMYPGAKRADVALLVDAAIEAGTVSAKQRESIVEKGQKYGLEWVRDLIKNLANPGRSTRR